MTGKPDTKGWQWGWGPLVFSLSLLAMLSTPGVTTAQTAGAVCTIRVFGNGDLLAVFTTPPTNFAVAVAIPTDRDVVVPVLCEDLDVIGLGVANQEKNKDVTFRARVFDNQGIFFCEKGDFTIPPRGGRGVTFAECPAP